MNPLEPPDDVAPKPGPADPLAQGRRALAAGRAEAAVKLDARARALGFVDLASYLPSRHHDLRWPRRLIANGLGVTVPVVARLMRGAGVSGMRGVSTATALRTAQRL